MKNKIIEIAYKPTENSEIYKKLSKRIQPLSTTEQLVIHENISGDQLAFYSFHFIIGKAINSKKNEMTSNYRKLFQMAGKSPMKSLMNVWNLRMRSG